MEHLENCCPNLRSVAKTKYIEKQKYSVNHFLSNIKEIFIKKMPAKAVKHHNNCMEKVYVSVSPEEAWKQH